MDTATTQSLVELRAAEMPSLACGEVTGGNAPVNQPVALPGPNGVLYSLPSHGERGGDVHYLSVCGAGLLARLCVADVRGHGDVVASVSAQMHAHLQRTVDVIDERRVFSEMDKRLQTIGVRAMTTAALLTYYPPSRRLTVAYAGHPPGWLYASTERRWVRLEVERPPDAGVTWNLPVATGLPGAYARSRRRMAEGDRVVLVTDGVLDADNPAGDAFGAAGVERVLRQTAADDVESVVPALLEAMADHTHGAPATDDVTIFAGEIVSGPRGPGAWPILRNRLLTGMIPPAR